MASDSTCNSPVLFATEEDDDVDMGWSWDGWHDPATQAVIESLTKDDLQIDEAMSDGNPSQSLHVMRSLSPDCQSQSSYVMETPPPPSFRRLCRTAEPLFLAGLGNSGPPSQIMTPSSQVPLQPQQLFSKRTKKSQKNTCRPQKMLKVPGFNCKLNGGDYMVVARDLDVLEAIDKALAAVKEKIPENTFISASSVRALSLQLNQIEKIFEILYRNINLPLELPPEVWEEMFTVSENVFYATREQLEQYKRLTSSTEDLSAFFSQNLIISSGNTAATPNSSQRGRTARASRLNASASQAILPTPVSSVNRRTSQSQPPRQRATGKRCLPSTQPASQQTPVLNASQVDLTSSLPAVVIRGRPKGSVGQKKTPNRSKSLASLPSKQSTNANDNLDDDDFYSPPQSLAFYGFGSKTPVRQNQTRARSTTKAPPAQEAFLQPPQTSSAEDERPERNIVTVDAQLEPNIVTVVEETEPLIPVTEDENPVSVVNETDQSQIAVNVLDKDAVVSPLQALAVLTSQEKTRDGDDLDLFYSSEQSGSFEDYSQRLPDEVEEPLTQQIQHMTDHDYAVEVVIENYSQRLPDEVEEPSSQLSTVPIFNPATGARASSSPSERYKHFSMLTHNLFTLRPFLLDGTLSPGQNNLQMNFLNQVFKGSLKADGYIEVNGFAFACIGDWIKHVAGIRYSSFRIHQKASLQLLYGEDSRALEEIIPSHKIPALKGPKKVTPSKRRYNEIPVVVTRSISIGEQPNTSIVTEPIVVTRSTPISKQPSTSTVAEPVVVARSTPLNEQPSTSTVPEPVVNNDMQLVPSYPQISVRKEADMLRAEEDGIELQLVPDEMLTHVRTIVTHSEAEYFPICDCIEQYWNGSKPFPDFLLADLENW